MAIANRITRLFRADVHAVLDIIEEPEAILKQSIGLHPVHAVQFSLPKGLLRSCSALF